MTLQDLAPPFSDSISCSSTFPHFSLAHWSHKLVLTSEPLHMWDPPTCSLFPSKPPACLHFFLGLWPNITLFEMLALATLSKEVYLILPSNLDFFILLYYSLFVLFSLLTWILEDRDSAIFTAIIPAPRTALGTEVMLSKHSLNFWFVMCHMSISQKWMLDFLTMIEASSPTFDLHLPIWCLVCCIE